MHVAVWWTYDDGDPERLANGAAAVVDCLRATTSVVAALAAGASGVIPVAEEATARQLAASRRAVLAGERECLPPPGFDLGNSPRAFSPACISGRPVVLWTTNGSRALCTAAAAQPLVAFALVNVGAAAAFLRAHPQLTIICAGTEGHFSLEDAFCAGALLQRLQALGVALSLDEQALAALLLYRGGRDDPARVLHGGAAAAKLASRGLSADVTFAAQVDRFPLVPVWRGDMLHAVSIRLEPGQPAQEGQGAG